MAQMGYQTRMDHVGNGHIHENFTALYTVATHPPIMLVHSDLLQGWLGQNVRSPGNK